MPPNRFDRAAPPRPPKAPGKAFLAQLDRLRRLASSCGAAVERSTRSLTSPTTVSGLGGELCPRGRPVPRAEGPRRRHRARGHPASGAATRPPWISTAGSTRSWIERDGGLSRPSGDPGRRDGLYPAASVTTAGPRGGSAGRDVGSRKSAQPPGGPCPHNGGTHPGHHRDVPAREPTRRAQLRARGGRGPLTRPPPLSGAAEPEPRLRRQGGVGGGCAGHRDGVGGSRFPPRRASAASVRAHLRRTQDRGRELGDGRSRCNPRGSVPGPRGGRGHPRSWQGSGSAGPSVLLGGRGGLGPLGSAECLAGAVLPYLPMDQTSAQVGKRLGPTTSSQTMSGTQRSPRSRGRARAADRLHACFAADSMDQLASVVVALRLRGQHPSSSTTRARSKARGRRAELRR
jgi:hypothetical protein